LEKIFQNILVPVDGSLQSRTSQEMAIFICQLFKSNVTLIHVVSNELILGGQTYIPRENYAPISTATGQFPRALSLPKNRENVLPDEVIMEIFEGYREEGQTILAKSASFFSQKGIIVKKKLVEKNVISEAIITEADSGGYDLIIIGNSGGEENELDLHLGSVAKKVSLAVKIPALVVRKKNEIRKILVPVDGSPKEDRALQKVSAIAKSTGSKVILLHVQEKSLLNLRPEIKEVGFQILKDSLTKMNHTESEQLLLFGDPANLIIQTANQYDVDLVALNSGGNRTLSGFFLGSISDHVLHHATVPVLLLR
jgi:nucleotide-binding universal stress UspA family protein